MKLAYKISLLIILLCQSFLIAQKTSYAKPILNGAYFNEYSVENYFLDMDKNQYLAGENIWFKLYVLEEKSTMLNLLAENLHVSLYDQNGAKMSSQILKPDNGVVYGNFKTDKDFISGEYYLQVNSNYNSNFKTSKSFSLKIISLDKLPKSEFTETNGINHNLSSSKPNITFHPESNILIKNIFNKIIIKTNLPVDSKIEIIDKKNNKKINTSTVDEQGNAITFFNYENTYEAKVSINKQEFIYQIPIAQPEGFTIFKNRTLKNALKQTFVLKTNEVTAKTSDHKKLFVILHKKGFIKSFAELNLDANKTKYLLSFNNKDLFEGVNTISVFSEENKPLVERYFFNESLNPNIKLSKVNTSADSTKVQLSSDNLSKFANLSISVHAVNFNQKKNNIKSSIYFDDNDDTFIQSNLFLNNHNYVDNYLQTQSKDLSPYPYKDISKREFIFKRENGIKIKGRVNKKLINPSEYKVMLTSKENGLLLVQQMKKNQTFEFKNMSIKKGSKYEMALLNKKGKIINANFYIFQQFTEFQNKLTIHNKIEIDSKKIKITSEEEKEEDNNTQFISYKNLELLDEVYISSNKADKDKKNEIDLKNKGVIGAGFSRIFKPSNSPYSNVNILQFLQTLPGVTLKYTSDSSPFLNNERVLKTFNNIGDTPFGIILDGTPIGTDLSLIDFRQASEFEYIVVNKRGAGFGQNFPNGVITLVTLKGLDGKPLARKNKNLTNFIAEFGFSENYERFETSSLNFATKSTKESYKTLDWYPNVNILKNKKTILNFNNEGFENLKISINGITDDGKLIYQTIAL